MSSDIYSLEQFKARQHAANEWQQNWIFENFEIPQFFFKSAKCVVCFCFTMYTMFIKKNERKCFKIIFLIFYILSVLIFFNVFSPPIFIVNGWHHLNVLNPWNTL